MLKKITHRFKSRFFRVRVNKRSKIYDLLLENWENYKIDLYPKDRRMCILEIKDISGMNTENIRLFINETVRRFANNGIYLEVGTFKGSSLLSAALFNLSTHCIGIDNFSQFNPEIKNELILKINFQKFDNPKNIEFYNQDYEEAIRYLFYNKPTLKVNVYYYDGWHSYENQIRGLRIMLPHLAYKCVILIDDINKSQVKKANRDFIKENRDFKSVFTMRTKGNCSNDWWNGLEVITRGI
jgi:tRNA G46 methylase TrmB